jgi:hypothetical protein
VYFPGFLYISACGEKTLEKFSGLAKDEREVDRVFAGFRFEAGCP